MASAALPPRVHPRLARALGWVAWAWTLTVFVLLWMPPPPPPEIVWPWWDSLVHTGLMTVFGALWTWRDGLVHGPRARGGLRVLGLGAAVGALTEIGQALLPWDRRASWDDLAFDLVGTMLGWLLARALVRARVPDAA